MSSCLLFVDRIKMSLLFLKYSIACKFDKFRDSVAWDAVLKPYCSGIQVSLLLQSMGHDRAHVIFCLLLLEITGTKCFLCFTLL